MVRKSLLLLGAAAALVAALVIGCGDTGSSATGCDASLPCTVSINVN